jgi:hypothetical protein
MAVALGVVLKASANPAVRARIHDLHTEVMTLSGVPRMVETLNPRVTAAFHLNVAKAFLNAAPIAKNPRSGLTDPLDSKTTDSFTIHAAKKSFAMA